jgi:hypothetical protein
MSSARVAALLLALVAALAGAACGDPPDKELQQAQAAIDAARTAGAEQFAHDEYVAAQDSLKRANDAVGQRDYRMALNLALDARERAQNAAKEATDGTKAARTTAERALADAAAALADARSRLREAERSHVVPKKIAAARQTIDAQDDALQEARTQFSRGEYVPATDAAAAIAAKLRGSTHDLVATGGPPPKPPRRRR